MLLIFQSNRVSPKLFREAYLTYYQDSPNDLISILLENAIVSP